MIVNQFIESGLRTAFVSIKTTIPATATRFIPINTKLPSQIGQIYGISILLSGLTDDNNAVIVSGQERQLYLTLKRGASNFVDNLRLSELVFDSTLEKKYLDVNLPGYNFITESGSYAGIDLDVSFYGNPAALVANVIVLNFWYIPTHGKKAIVR